MANRKLLKEAIADAKTVKSMAISNAKNALTEAFTPQLTSMLSAQLQEMEDEDEETIDEVVDDNEDEAVNEEEDLNVDEILSELDEESDEDAENLDESDEDEDESEDEDDEDEEFDSKDFTEDDLTAFIEDVISNMDLDALGDDEEEGDLEGVEDMEGVEGELEDEVDLAELLAEIDAMQESDDEEEKETIDEGFMDKIVKAVNRLGSSGAVEDLIKDKLPSVVSAAKKTGKLSSDFEPSQELVDSITLKAKEDGGAGTIIFKDGKVQYQQGSDTKGTPQASTHESLEIELNEAYKVIKSLRTDLSEINLLNAKLLYTNKIFKDKKHLTEGQKVKVLETFDKASTVKEVKLVHETLSTGLVSSKNSINENVGGGSRAIGSTKSKNPIIAADDAFARMNEIAFYDVKH